MGHKLSEIKLFSLWKADAINSLLLSSNFSSPVHICQLPSNSAWVSLPKFFPLTWGTASLHLLGGVILSCICSTSSQSYLLALSPVFCGGQLENIPLIASIPFVVLFFPVSILHSQHFLHCLSTILTLEVLNLCLFLGESKLGQLHTTNFHRNSSLTNTELFGRGKGCVLRLLSSFFKISLEKQE